tara:strand:- start:4544 stop:4960 length:417 start_codon:yes stop_codon:yes gene_type:complete
MDKTYYKCKYCGKDLYGQRRKFCSRKCNSAWQGEQYKMDYGQGKKHNDPVSPEQRQYIGTVETAHVPYEILEQAKVYTDSYSGGYTHFLGHKPVDDWMDINEAIYELNVYFPKKYRKVKSDDKQLEKHFPGISRKDFN